LDKVKQGVLSVEDAVARLRTLPFEDVGFAKIDHHRALRKGLGYCWSVAVAAYPQEGKRFMEKWIMNKDQDIEWIMKENLKKNRLQKMDSRWVAGMKANLD